MLITILEFKYCNTQAMTEYPTHNPFVILVTLVLKNELLFEVYFLFALQCHSSVEICPCCYGLTEQQND